MARACCTTSDPWRKTAYSDAPLLQDEASCQLCVMHVVQCCPEHCVLRPPLLPRLEFLRDIRSANSCLKNQDMCLSVSQMLPRWTYPLDNSHYIIILLSLVMYPLAESHTRRTHLVPIHTVPCMNKCENGVYVCSGYTL